jgi:hypothetical protein
MGKFVRVGKFRRLGDTISAKKYYLCPVFVQPGAKKMPPLKGDGS